MFDKFIISAASALGTILFIGAIEDAMQGEYIIALAEVFCVAINAHTVASVLLRKE